MLRVQLCEACGTVECLERSQIPPALVQSLKVADGYETRRALLDERRALETGF